MSVNAPDAGGAVLPASALTLAERGLSDTYNVAVSAQAASIKLLTREARLVGWSFVDAAAFDIPSVTQVTNSSTLPAASNDVQVAAGPAGSLNYVTGFEVTGGGATAASILTLTLQGVVGGNITYKVAIPAGATLGITPLTVEFPGGGLAAAALAGAIVLACPSFGVGNTDAAVTIHGYTNSSGGAVAGVTTPGGARFLLHDGADATGEIVGGASLLPNGTASQFLGATGVPIQSGIFLEVLAGSITGVLYFRIRES